MPELAPVANVSRVVMSWTYNGVRCANVLHYMNMDNGGGGNAAAIAPRIIANFAGNPINHIPNSAQLDKITVTPLDEFASPPEEYLTGLPLQGTSPIGALPGNVTLVTTFKTQFGGRSYRGRSYWIGLHEGDVFGNNVTGEMRGIVEGFWELMRVLEPATGEATYQLCVVSYYANKGLRTVPVATPVVSVSTNTRIDTQRRRMS
jgi:hypothetical protein